MRVKRVTDEKCDGCQIHLPGTHGKHEPLVLVDGHWVEPPRDPARVDSIPLTPELHEKPRLIRNLSTPESREYWRRTEEAAATTTIAVTPELRALVEAWEEAVKRDDMSGACDHCCLPWHEPAAAMSLARAVLAAMKKTKGDGG